MTSNRSRISVFSEDGQRESERDKLIKLVQIWRSKYEKLYIEAQNFDSIISNLKKDIEQQKTEKENISTGLRATIQKERADAEAKITELQTVADTAAKKSELQTRDLKTKLRRLENETQPIIDMYKERDVKFQKMVAQEKKVNAELENKLTELKATLEHSDLDKATEVAELKRNFYRNNWQMRILLAAKIERMIETARVNAIRETKNGLKSNTIDKEHSSMPEQKLDVKAWEEKRQEQDRIMEGMKAEMTRMKEMKQVEILELQTKVSTLAAEKRRVVEELTGQIMRLRKKSELTRLKQEQDCIVEAMRSEMKTMMEKNQVEIVELKTKVSALATEKRRVVEDLSGQIMRLRKKSEQTRLKLQQREAVIKNLRNTITQASKRLEADRVTSKVICKTSIPVRQLSQQLLITIRETRSIEKALKRFDILKHNGKFIESDDVLRLEVLYSSKMSEISRLRRLLHNKLIEEDYGVSHANKKPISDSYALTHQEYQSNGDEDIVFLRSDYGSDSDSQISSSDHEDSDKDVAMRIHNRTKNTGRFSMEEADRTSWMLPQKHYSDVTRFRM